LHISPRTRHTQIIQKGRPLWQAQLTWTLPNTDKLADLRYYLEALDGYAGNVQIWDFASPYPYGALSAANGPARIYWFNETTQETWVSGASPYFWKNGTPAPLAAAVAVGAMTITFSGLPATALLCVRGQYIQIGKRLYLSAGRVTVASNGTATVPLVYPIIEAAAVGAGVSFVNAACEMRLENQNWQSAGRAGDGLVTVSASFIETV
jgi:hypothetical protein